MYRLLILPVMLALSGMASAQDTPDLLGIWTFEVVVAEPDRRCGQMRTIGEMNVTKKITARAHQRHTKTHHQTERCGKIGFADSGFTLRIRDNKVTIEYDEEEGWASDTLLLDGKEMTGADAGGIEFTFVKQEVKTVAVAVANIDMTELNQFLDELAPGFNKALRAEYGTKMLHNLRRTGMSREEAIEVATKTVERMTDCVMDLVREEVVAMNIPLEKVRQNQKSVLMQPQDVDYREIECVYDTALNAGVVIH
jgi:hypothetical protein